MYAKGQRWGQPANRMHSTPRQSMTPAQGGGLLDSLQNPWGGGSQPSDQTMVDPAFDIGGVPQYPFGEQVDPNLPVYRPEVQQGLMDAEDGQDLVSKFAGGLLNGMQVRQPTNSTSYGQTPGTQATNLGFSGPNAMGPGDSGPTNSPAISEQGYDGTNVYATNPSGVYTSDAPAPTAETTPTAKVNPGVFNTMDLMRFQQALNQGAAGTEIGNQTGATVITPDQIFEQDGAGWKFQDHVKERMDRPITFERSGADPTDPQAQLRWAMSKYGQDQNLMGN